MWWGLFVSASSVFDELALYRTIAGPIIITLLLLFVSGIPLLEKKANKTHGSNVEYQQYKSQTSPLVPLPPTIYSRLPKALKFVFCDWYNYDKRRKPE